MELNQKSNAGRHGTWLSIVNCVVYEMKKNNFHVIRRTYTTSRNSRCNLGVQWRLCLDVTSDLNTVVNNVRTHMDGEHQTSTQQREKVPDLKHFPPKNIHLYVCVCVCVCRKAVDVLMGIYFCFSFRSHTIAYFVCTAATHNGIYFCVSVFSFSQKQTLLVPVLAFMDLSVCETALKCPDNFLKRQSEIGSLRLQQNIYSIPGTTGHKLIAILFYPNRPFPRNNFEFKNHQFSGHMTNWILFSCSF